MRILKWDPMFSFEEEMLTTVAWTSFPSLSPKFFWQEAVFPLAAIVRKPLQVDMTIKNKSSSCARVKVKVDLLGEFTKRIKIWTERADEEVIEKWIQIQ